jgi:hypothetical protein
MIAKTTVTKKEDATNETYYEIEGLPVGKKLMAVTTHPIFSKNPTIKIFTLRPGEQRKMNLTIITPCEYR